MIEEMKMGPPPWSKAPDDANWLAMDEDGTWHWFLTQPKILGALWFGGGDLEQEPDYHSGDRFWKDTLEPRPTDTGDDWTGHISPCAMRSYEDEAPADDPVNHPSHYTAGDIECIDAIRAALTPEEFRGFCKGNALKYVWRERRKGGGQDLGKARWYLGKLSE